jgi:hypothetical protein
LGRRDHLALGASAKQIDVIGYLIAKKWCAPITVYVSVHAYLQQDMFVHYEVVTYLDLHIFM